MAQHAPRRYPRRCSAARPASGLQRNRAVPSLTDPCRRHALANTATTLAVSALLLLAVLPLSASGQPSIVEQHRFEEAQAGPGPRFANTAPLLQAEPVQGLTGSCPHHCSTCLGTCSDGLCDNLSFFLGFEASKQPQDFGANANFGARFALNWGIPVAPSLGIGAQLGTSINATANAVELFELLGESSERVQNFTTVGIYQRTASGFHWGAVYDFLYQDSYDEFFLGQWRLQSGYDLSCWDEVGVQVALSQHDDTGQFNAIDVTLNPITHGSVYWRHTWENRAQTTFWLGISDGHSAENVILGSQPPKSEQFLFGADMFIPLNDCVALFGEANFIMPTDTGTVDAYLGFEIFPRGGAYHARHSQFSPLMPVANSTSFAVDLER